MNIPSEWAVVRLKDIVLDTQPGFAQRPGEEEDEGATPQIRTHNVSPDGQIDLTGIKYVTLPDEESNRYRLTPQDIIFNNTNSEEWVGKTALFEEEGTYLFSNHMTRIRTNQQFVEPEYLARYLHFLWQAGYSRQRAKRWVSQAAVDQSTLLEFKILLPTLPEQQRIVSILRQAEELRRLRRKALEQAEKLSSTLFLEMFGSLLLSNGRKHFSEVRLGEFIDSADYGISVPLTETGELAVVRMNNITTDGWLALDDIKYCEESSGTTTFPRLRLGDLLFNRTNSKDLVGKTCLWEGPGEDFSFASYLIRLRLKDELLPEYVWGYLNSPFGNSSDKNQAAIAP